jgi:hypothetical protein
LLAIALTAGALYFLLPTMSIGKRSVHKMFFDKRGLTDDGGMNIMPINPIGLIG